MGVVIKKKAAALTLIADPDSYESVVFFPRYVLREQLSAKWTISSRTVFETGIPI